MTLCQNPVALDNIYSMLRSLGQSKLKYSDTHNMTLSGSSLL